MLKREHRLSCGYRWAHCCRNTKFSQFVLSDLSCRYNVRQVWEAALQVTIAFTLNPALLWSLPRRSALAITFVELVDSVVHAFHDLQRWLTSRWLAGARQHDLGKRREVHAIQVGVIPKVDEQLRSAWVLPACSERYETCKSGAFSSSQVNSSCWYWERKLIIMILRRSRHLACWILWPDRPA